MKAKFVGESTERTKGTKRSREGLNFGSSGGAIVRQSLAGTMAGKVCKEAENLSPVS
jgi:hypothetical protein